MVNRRAQGLGKLVEMNTQGQVTTKPGAAVDPNAGIWFTASASLRRAGQALGAMAERAMQRREKAAIETATAEGQMAGYKADLGTGSGFQISDDLKSGISATAKALQIDPVDLATVISYETKGTFDPTIKGPTTKWGTHRGLIQFGEPQAKQYGVDWNNPIASQLGENGAIARYLKDRGVKPGMGLLDIYSAINAGSVGKPNASDAAAGGAPGTVRDKVENQMAGHRAKAQRLFSGGSVAGTGRPSSTGPALALRQDKTTMGDPYWASKNRFIARRYPAEVTQGLDDLYEENKDDPIALAKAFDDFERKSLGKLAKETNNDPDMLLLGEQTFMQKRRVYERSAQAAEDARVRDGERSDYDQTIGTARTNLQKQAYLAANDEEAGSSLDVAINENLGSIETALQAGVISPEVATRDRKTILDTVTLGRIDGTFDALPDPESKARFVEGLKDSWAKGEELLQGLSLEQVQALERKYAGAISTEKRTQTAAAKLQEQKMQGMIRDDLASTRSTGIGLSIDGAELGYDQVKAVLGETAATNWQHDRQVQAGIYNATAGLDVMSPTEINAHLQRLEPKAGSAGFIDQTTVYNAAQKRASEIDKQRKEDPALAVDQAFDELTALREKAYEGDLVALEGMIKGRLEAQEAIGIPDYAKAPLTNGEAQSLLAPLPDNPTKQDWLNEAAKWDRTYGPYANDVQEQLLHMKGLHKDLVAAARQYLKGYPLGNAPSRLQRNGVEEKAMAVEAEQSINGWARQKMAEQDQYNQEVDALKQAKDHRGRPISSAMPDLVLWPDSPSITALINNPDQAPAFDAAFGKGAAAYYLEKHQRDQEDLQRYLDAAAAEQGLTYEDWLSDQETPAQHQQQPIVSEKTSNRYQQRHRRHK